MDPSFFFFGSFVWKLAHHSYKCQLNPCRAPSKWQRYTWSVWLWSKTKKLPIGSILRQQGHTKTVKAVSEKFKFTHISFTELKQLHNAVHRAQWKKWHAELLKRCIISIAVLSLLCVSHEEPFMSSMMHRFTTFLEHFKSVTPVYVVWVCVELLMKKNL